MEQNTLLNQISELLIKMTDKKLIFGAQVAVFHAKSNQTIVASSGNLDHNRPYFIASTTKIYITALLIQLQQEGHLHFSDLISKYLDSHIIEHLHVINNKDYSFDLTVNHLMSHTSGLPDYFQAPTAKGKSLLEQLTLQQDSHWTFDDVIHKTKNLSPLFSPGTKHKAHYSDSNFQILGKIIEVICQDNLSQILKNRIFSPLNLTQTYLYQDTHDHSPHDICFKNKLLHIPSAMRSFGPDGGIVSTAQESLIFIRAFFEGRLFHKNTLTSLYHWNPIFFPLESGIGLFRFKVPWYFKPFGYRPVLLGHSGLSGAFAFYEPIKDIFLAGTVNQIHRPDLSYRLMIKIIQLYSKANL